MIKLLICSEGVEGKKLCMTLKLTNKRVIIKKGCEPDVSLTEDEEKALLKVKFPKGWKVKKKEEKKKSEKDLEVKE